MNTKMTLSGLALLAALGMGVQGTALAAETNATDKSATDTASDAVSDTWITTKVKAELAATDDLDSTDISVTTNEGVVTLTGVLPDDLQVKKARAATESVKGVQKVDDSGLKSKE